MRILITGSNGLLGQKIVRQLLKRDIDFLATSTGENRNPHCPDERYCPMDITDPKEVQKIMSEYQPGAVINTAAMTNVDACEENEALCRKINVAGTRNLFDTCKNGNIHFVHLSTDFVFDGENGPYKETDERNPLSVYAQSKADSEDILIESDNGNWSILRTIIVFGKAENMSRSNIVLWAKDALRQGQKLTIVDDQFRAPTWADDLAWACIETCLQHETGIFHISGPETFSIYELVCRIADFHGYDKSLITPIKSDTLNQKAKRPPKTGFVLEKARKHLGYNPMTFEESLKLLQKNQG